MKKLILLLCFILPIVIHAQISLHEWTLPKAVSDSAQNNRNACLRGTEDNLIVFWEQDVDATTTRICYKDLGDPSGLIRIAVEETGVKLTNPKILELNTIERNFLLMYQTNKQNEEDLMFIGFKPDGSMSEPQTLAAPEGNDRNLCCNQYKVVWENEGKVYIAEYQYTTNNFTAPYLVEGNGAHSPFYSNNDLNFLVPFADSTRLISRWVDFINGSWVQTPYQDVAFEGVCTGPNSCMQWMGMQLCMQQDIESKKSGIVIHENNSYTQYHRSEQYNFTEPAICDFVIGVKGMLGLYFLAYVSDSLSEPEIFVENPQMFNQPVNISQWPGTDQNPSYFISYHYPNIIRVNLLWESIREGNSTIYRSYLDYIFGGKDELTKVETLKISPSPFTNETNITFLSGDKAIFRIIDLQGREVRTLQPKIIENGSQQMVWDGTTQSGVAVPSGCYVVLCISGEKTVSRIIIKK